MPYAQLLEVSDRQRLRYQNILYIVKKNCALHAVWATGTDPLTPTPSAPFRRGQIHRLQRRDYTGVVAFGQWGCGSGDKTGTRTSNS